MPRRIALIIGVSQYNNSRTGLANLVAPVTDAQTIYDVLYQYGDFDSLQTLPLGTQGVDSSGFVYATELLERIKELFNPSTTDEVELAVIYFSGHGVSDRGQVVYLSASDERLAVALSWLANLAKSSSIQNICIWLDCCYSGEILEFAELGDKGFCVVAASHAQGEALAKGGHSLLTDLLCRALIPTPETRQEIRVLDFIQTIEAERKNLPQQVLCRWGNQPFTLTQWQGEVAIRSPYPPDYPPYKGLLTFQATDQSFFFGRDAMVQQLLDRLSSSRFVPLLGASGSGKSSLVLAGLLPQLVKDDWQIVVMRPAAQPLQSLRDVLVRSFPDKTMGSIANSVDLERELGQVVGEGKQFLLVIDQFEEVFTECRSEMDRTAFFACLLEAVKGDNALHIVLTLRSDFLGHCTEQIYSGLGQRLQQDALFLIALSASELREVITRPLALVGMRCEQALEDELVDQILHEKGSLPLLQYVLEKLWQTARQQGCRELTLSMYQSLGGQQGGGLRGVLNEKADAFYQQLEPQQQRLMEWLMVELVGNGQEDIRRTVTLQELHQRQPDYVEALDQLLAQLVTQERLLIQDQDNQGLATVTVAHEALIRDWQRLRGWLETNREIKSWRLRLEDSIAAWKNKVSGSLLRERRLAEAQQIIDRNSDSLLIGKHERAFIAASQADAKRRKQWQLGAVTVFIGVLLVGVLATLWQANKAEERRQEAEKKTLEASYNLAKVFEEKSLLTLNKWQEEKDPILIRQAWLYALEALKNLSQKENAILHPDLSSRLAAINEQDLLIELKKISTHQIDSILTYSPDGKTIAASANDTVMLWDSISGNFIKTIGGYLPDIKTLAYNPDGKTIAIANSNEIRLWDLKNDKNIGTIYLNDLSASEIIYSPDGKIITSLFNEDNYFSSTVNLWSSTNGKLIKKLNVDRKIEALAYNLSGKIMASSFSNNTVKIWDVESGESIRTLNNISASILVYGSGNNAIIFGYGGLQIWDFEKGVLLKDIKDITEVTSIVFNKNSFIIGSKDGSIYLLSETTKLHKKIINNQQPVHALACSPDGKTIIAQDSNKVIYEWTLSSDGLYYHQNQSLSNGFLSHMLVYSSDGKKIFSSNGSTIQSWDAATGDILDSIQFSSNLINLPIGYSLDGKVTLHQLFDGTLQLFDAETKKIFRTLEIPRSRSIYIGSFPPVAFSPDRRMIAIGKLSSIFLWDINSGKIINEINTKLYINSIMFSPDNKFIALSSFDEKGVQIWNIESNIIAGPIEIKNYTSLHVSNNFFAFSPDSSTIAIATSKNIELWDFKKATLLKVLDFGLKSSIRNLIYSPNGKRVTASFAGGEVKSWDTTNANLVQNYFVDESLFGLAYSPDGKNMVGASLKGLIWLNISLSEKSYEANIEKYKDIVRKNEHYTDISASSPNSITLAYVNKYIDPNVIRLTDNNMGGKDKMSLRHGYNGYVTAVVWRADGTIIASGSDDGIIKLWNAHTGELLKTLQGHTEAIRDILFSPDGKAIFSSSSDKTIKVWDSERGIALYTLQGKIITAGLLSYSPDNKIIISSEGLDFNRVIEAWDMTSPSFRLIYDFDPAAVLEVLRFLWEMELEGLEYKHNPLPYALYPQMGYHISFNEETRKLRPLLDAPHSDETKLGQVVRFLEAQCAYKRQEDKQACEAKRP
ncbi:MAG: caspase family protein [Thiofilum sp.]|uniref:nSTAND1 domain-containing NTPase n=1 Tax=Thiofilum sp. TaxID=2212733 RepID=UPI0025E32E01|nr:caspase family protein [Thiofilum sp.]MBK8454291.1 caspase family protein [Thiofilum sp.]